MALSQPIDLRALLGDVLMDGRFTSVPMDTLDDCVIGLYFSAHWCPPCRHFTPILRDVYSKLQVAGKRFEVIFISSDRSEPEFKAYFGTMPWLALPYDKQQQRAQVAQRFGINGIPALVLVEKGVIINANARSAVLQDHAPGGAQFPWRGQGDTAGVGGGTNWTFLAILAVIYLALRYIFKLI